MNNDAGENVFDIKAATWDDNPHRLEMAAALAEKIKQTVILNKQTEAMDFGCGTGLVSMQLAGSVKSITAVDTSKQMLQVLSEKLAKSKINNVKTEEIDLTAESALSGSFDLIFSSMAFHHVERPATLLERFFDLLRHGGTVAICDLDMEDGSFHSDMKVAHNGFDRDEFSAWLEDVGFGEIKTQTAHVINRSDSNGVFREYPIFLITAVKK